MTLAYPKNVGFSSRSSHIRIQQNSTCLIDMQISIQVFKPEYKTDLTQIKRFGCLAYMKNTEKDWIKIQIHRKANNSSWI